jgi:methyl-accepting chemotaxis protein
MFRWFNNMSLKRKLYSIFGIIIISTIVGIIIGQITFARVQVGGVVYSAIEKNMQLANDIVKIRANLGIIWAHLTTMILEESREKRQEHHDAIKELTNRIDELFDMIEKSNPPAEVMTHLKKARELCIAFRDTSDKEIIPLIYAGKIADAKAIAMGIQAERYNEFLVETKEAVDKVRAQVSQMVEKIKKESIILRWAYIIGGVVFILFLLSLAQFFSSTIVTPVVSVARASKAMADGKFETVDIKALGKDEVGKMVESFAEMSTRIGKMISSIKGDVMKLLATSEKLSATAEKLTTGARQQASQTEQVATAMTEMSQTIIDVAKNSAQAADAAKDSSSIASKGRDSVERTVKGMLSIAETVKSAALTIEELRRSSNEIGNIIMVIDDIADQTNLLALNAAIEAARAGEQGRGFAVVADEVRKLAERTGKATKEIAGMIKKIQAETEKSVKGMEIGKTEVEQGVRLAEEARESLNLIVQTANMGADMIQRIATAAEEQSTVSEQVSASTERIAEISKKTEELTNQVREASEELTKLAYELRDIISWFKVNGGKMGGYN